MKERSVPSTRYVVTVMALWLSLALVNLLSHEMWRDELQAWTIARASHSLLNLFENMRYEGNPGLWGVCLFFLARPGSSPVAMQMLNLAIASAATYLLIRFAPFPRWLSVMLAFGYFLAYEYTAISRPYGLGMLLIFACCAVVTRDMRGQFVVLSVVLSALALTSVYGVIAAIALATGAVVDVWLRRTDSGPNRWRPAAGLAVVVAAAALVSALLMRQPADTGFAVSPTLAVSGDKAALAAASVWNGLVPLPPLTTAFWNGNILDGRPFVKAGAGLLVLLGALLSLRWQAVGLTIFAVNTCGLLLFTYLFYFGGARHHGHYFLGLVAACWIASATRSVSGIEEPAPARLASSAEKGFDSANSARAARLPGARLSVLGRVPGAGAGYTSAWRFLGLLAAAHILAGIYAQALDIRVPFSGSRAAAAHIASHYPPDIPIVADPELPGVPLAALLHRDLYFAQSDRWGSFVIWNNRHQPSSLDRSVAAADRLAQALRRDVLLVLAYPEIPPLRFRHVGHFPGAIMTAESYDVYLLPSVAR